MAVNVVCLAGNLTRDAELKQTTNGNAVLTFTLAVNEPYKNPTTGTWDKRPNFFDCVMFGARADKLAQYIHKGSKVSIAGRLRYRTWEQDGAKRSKVEVVADEIELMSRDQQQQPKQQQQTQQGGFYDADIPF